MGSFQDNTRRVSFGRGGAGNIRSPAEATLPDAQSGHTQRRRSSAWSSSSSTTSISKKAKLFGNVKNLFSKTDDTTESKERML